MLRRLQQQMQQVEQARAQDEIEALRTTLADTESARRQTETTLAGTRQSLGRCVDRNGRL